MLLLNCVLLLWALCFAQSAAAEEVRLVPSLTLQEQYNDNIFFAATGERRAFITSISPAVELSSRCERSQARLSARMNGLLYQGNGSLNSVEQAYLGSVGYRVTPTAKFGLEGRFSRESRPDRSIESAGLVEATKSSRQFYALSSEWIWSEKTTSSVAYSYDQLDYDNRRDLDSRSHSATLALVHQLGLHLPGLNGRGTLGLNRNDFSAATVDSLSAMVGASYALHELWSAGADLGGRYTTSDARTASPSRPAMESVERTSNSTGWVANVALSYRGELSSGNLFFQRNVSVASGLGGAVERTALVLDLNHLLSYEFSARLSAGYYLNQSEQGELSAKAIDETSFRINPSLRYEFSPELAAEASYQYTRIIYHLSDRWAGQNRFFIRLSGYLPLFE